MLLKTFSSHSFFFQQSHADSASRAMMEASMPLSIATPSAGEQFSDKFAALPSVYLTPSQRRNDKGCC